MSAFDFLSQNLQLQPVFLGLGEIYLYFCQSFGCFGETCRITRVEIGIRQSGFEPRRSHLKFVDARR